MIAFGGYEWWKAKADDHRKLRDEALDSFERDRQDECYRLAAQVAGDLRRAERAADPAAQLKDAIEREAHRLERDLRYSVSPDGRVAIEIMQSKLKDPLAVREAARIALDRLGLGKPEDYRKAQDLDCYIGYPKKK